MNLAAVIDEAIEVLALSGRPNAIRMADALDQYRRLPAVSIEACLGAADNWRAAEQLRHRNEMLVDIARQHFGAQDFGAIGRTAARQMLAALTRYEAGEYHQHLEANRRPDGVRGRLYDILALGVPSLKESTARALSRGSGAVSRTPFPLTAAKRTP